jgi:hypothetical protein
MSFHDTAFPVPAPQIRVDGWSPSRQRAFLETLAATGVICSACDAAHISERSAYALRIRRDGAAFRLGWDAAILVARARLADTLLARAIEGQMEVVTRDEDGTEMRRHRHDNRLAMSLLARLDRMADAPAEGSDAALARVVAQDFVAYLDMLSPPAAADDAAQPPAPADADGEPDTAPETAALSPGASAALFLAARAALLGSAAKGAERLFLTGEERCELRPEPPVPLMSLPPDEAARQLRGIWWDEDRQRWRTDFPPPPGFAGDESDPVYDMDHYDRDLTPEEDAALDARDAAERLPYARAAARARDAWFGFAPPPAPPSSAPGPGAGAAIR